MGFGSQFSFASFPPSFQFCFIFVKISSKVLMVLGTVLSSEKWSQVDMESGIGPPWQRESLVLPVTSQCL